MGARAIRLRIITEAAMTPRQVTRIVPNITVHCCPKSIQDEYSASVISIR
jgi:hypothetical protein